MQRLSSDAHRPGFVPGEVDREGRPTPRPAYFPWAQDHAKLSAHTRPIEDLRKAERILSSARGYENHAGLVRKAINHKLALEQA